MSVRHIHARRGEHVVVHRDKDSGGCAELVIGLILLGIMIKFLGGC